MLCLAVDEIKWNMQLEEQLSGLSDAETYYLLTTINTMALSRTVTDWTFIQATTLQILEVFLELCLCPLQHCYQHILRIEHSKCFPINMKKYDLKTLGKKFFYIF